MTNTDVEIVFLGDAHHELVIDSKVVAHGGEKVSVPQATAEHLVAVGSAVLSSDYVAPTEDTETDEAPASHTAIRQLKEAHERKGGVDDAT